MQRLSREVHDTWRDEVARASAADLRHRPRDTLTTVKVLAPFRLGGGRVAEVGEIVTVESWLIGGLIATRNVEPV
jgi:hypothetical protein